jgi:signal transduction histidine kinase
MRRCNGASRVEVSDRGPGFNPALIEDGLDGEQESQHLGLVGIRERVASLGGEFRIESAPGRGTRVLAVLPLQVVEVEPADA